MTDGRAPWLIMNTWGLRRIIQAAHKALLKLENKVVCIISWYGLALITLSFMHFWFDISQWCAPLSIIGAGQTCENSKLLIKLDKNKVTCMLYKISLNQIKVLCNCKGTIMAIPVTCGLPVMKDETSMKTGPKVLIKSPTIRAALLLLVYENIIVMLFEYYGNSSNWKVDCLFNSLFRLTTKKISKLCMAGPFKGKQLMISGFPSQRASNVESVSISWHHLVTIFNADLVLCLRSMPSRSMTHGE